MSRQRNCRSARAVPERRPRTILVALLLALAVLLPATLAPVRAQDDEAVPQLTGRVNDYADLIPAADEARISDRLAALEEETGAQVAVLTVERLGDLPIEDYSMRVVEDWQLGREAFDDGVLVLVARDERRMRIEVGYGLEPTLTDLRSRRIISEIMTPRFREGDFAGGIEAGVDAIGAAVRGEALPAPADRGGGTELGGRAMGMLGFLLVVGVLTLGALFSPGCVGWLLYVILAPFFFVFPAALFGWQAGLVALMLWLIVFPILKALVSVRLPDFGDGWTGHVGPFSGGGFGGGGFGGGGFGGFSGGGGSFGGGGASGGW